MSYVVLQCLSTLKMACDTGRGREKVWNMRRAWIDLPSTRTLHFVFHRSRYSQIFGGAVGKQIRHQRFKSFNERTKDHRLLKYIQETQERPTRKFEQNWIKFDQSVRYLTCLKLFIRHPYLMATLIELSVESVQIWQNNKGHWPKYFGLLGISIRSPFLTHNMGGQSMSWQNLRGSHGSYCLVTLYNFASGTWEELLRFDWHHARPANSCHVQRFLQLVNLDQDAMGANSTSDCPAA